MGLYNDLLVFVVDRSSEAERVWNALFAMRRSKLLGLENAIIVIKERTGEIRLRQEQNLSAATGDSGSVLMSNLAALIFGTPPEEVVRTVVRCGFDPRFLEEVARAMKDDCSAILFFVSSDTVADVDEMVSALALFRGKLHRTVLLPAVEGLLRKPGAMAA